MVLDDVSCEGETDAGALVLAAHHPFLPLTARIDSHDGRGVAAEGALVALRYVRRMTDLASPARVGSLLRDWRRRRRLSQLDLALEAGVSARHVSFVETGRSRPSPEMVLHLAERLDVPLRDRNGLLLAAGYAPVYAERELEAPDMEPVRTALDLVLRGHEPYPAAVVDRTWELVQGNRGDRRCCSRASDRACSRRRSTSCA